MEARLVYRTSYRAARATHRNPVSKKKKKRIERKGRREEGKERGAGEFLLFSSYLPNSKPGDGE